MSSAYPDLVIYLGIRAVLSLIGILVAVMSYWYAERKWDEQGSAAYATALENAPPENSEYQFVEEGSQNKKYVTNPDGSRDAISVCTEDFREEQRTNAVQVPREELEKALSIPYGILAGLALWTISFLFKTGHKVKPYFGWNISWLLFLPVIAVLIAFPIRNATIDRNLELKKKCVAAILVLSIWLIVSGIAEKETDAPWYFCVFGGAYEHVYLRMQANLPLILVPWQPYFCSFRTMQRDEAERWALRGNLRASRPPIFHRKVWEPFS